MTKRFFILLVFLSSTLFVIGCKNVALPDKNSNTQNNNNNDNTINKNKFPVRLENIKKIASETYLAGYISPDGTKVALSGDKFKGLYILDLESGNITALSEERSSGYAPLWSQDSKAIAYRVPGQPLNAVPIMFVDLNGNQVTPFLKPEEVFVVQNDTITIKTKKGTTAKIADPDTEGDRFFAPVAPEQGDYLVYSGLRTGLHLLNRSTGVKTDLGQGTHPAFSPDGTLLVYEVTQDDGSEITASDLFLVDLTEDPIKSQRLTYTEDVKELYPSLSNNRKLVYSADDGIYIADLVIEK